MEASSHGLNQNRLYGLKFDVGIFTNLSRDHLDYHKTFQNYFNSKLILFNLEDEKGGAKSKLPAYIREKERQSESMQNLFLR